MASSSASGLLSLLDDEDVEVQVCVGHSLRL